MKFEITLDVKDEAIQKHFKDFCQSLADRFAAGEKEYGVSSYMDMDLEEELKQELLDIPNYLLLRFIQMQKRKEAAKK